MGKHTTYTVEELIPIILGAALDMMAEVNKQNSLAAMCNDGIRMLAKVLIDQLRGEGEEE